MDFYVFRTFKMSCNFMGPINYWNILEKSDMFEIFYKHDNILNIAFARWGAHLPIAHTLRLLSSQELRFGLTKLNLRKKGEKNLPREFFGGGGGAIF